MAISGIKLSKKQVGVMWKLFQEGWSEQAIAKKCTISRTTVRAYKRREKWEERRAKIVRQAEQRADKKQVTILAENMEVVKLAKQKIGEQLRKIADGGAVSQNPIADLDKIIRLEEFLHGRPDSRPQIDYSDMTEEQLVVELKETLLELSGMPECREQLQELLS